MRLMQKLHKDWTNRCLVICWKLFSIEIDKLKKTSLLLASENTWQGAIIGNRWPYINTPAEVKVHFQQNLSKWKYVQGLIICLAKQ